MQRLRPLIRQFLYSSQIFYCYCFYMCYIWQGAVEYNDNDILHLIGSCVSSVLRESRCIQNIQLLIVLFALCCILPNIINREICRFPRHDVNRHLLFNNFLFASSQLQLVSDGFSSLLNTNANIHVFKLVLEGKQLLICLLLYCCGVQLMEKLGVIYAAKVVLIRFFILFVFCMWNAVLWAFGKDMTIHNSMLMHFACSG